MTLLLLIPSVAADPEAWRDQFDTALLSVGTTPVNIVCLGDSVTEGQGASTRAARWTAKLTDFLQTKYPVAQGGEGYVAALTETFSPDSPWENYTSVTGTVPIDTTVGSLGYRSATLAINDALTYTFTGTSVDIWWWRSSGGGSFTYAVDGGTAVTVSTAGATSTTTKTTVTLGASGSHTVTITRTAGTVTLQGFTVYDGDSTKGVRVYEGGHCAWDTNEYLNHTDYAGMIAFVTALAPDLVTVQLGINDYIHNTVTPAQYKTNLLKLMASLDALPKRPSVLLIDSYDIGSAVSNNGNTALQSDYKAKVQEVVALDPTHRGFLDFGASMPLTDTSGTGYYSTDAIHPNNAGHREIARQVISTVSPTPLPGQTVVTATGQAGPVALSWGTLANASWYTVRRDGEIIATDVTATTYGDTSVTGGTTYSYTVSGENWSGVGPQSDPVEATPTAVSGVLASESWSGAAGAAWPSQWTMGAQAGSSQVNASGQGEITTGTASYAVGPTAYLSGMADTVDTEVVFDAGFSTSGEQYICVNVRSDGALKSGDNVTNNGYYVSLILAAGNIEVGRVVNGTRTNLGSVAHSGGFSTSTRVNVRFRAVGSSIQVRVWNVGTSEPGTWQHNLTDSGYTTAGKVLLTALNGSAGGARTHSYDNLVVTNGSSATVPAQVTGLTATGSAGKVALAWSAVSDATSYKVYRDGTILTSSVASNAYNDTTGIVGTTYSYTVAAVNSAGTGPQSASASAAPLAAAPLGTWFTARDNRATTPARILTIGDSVTEGQGASTRANRWVDKFRDTLRSVYPTSGVTGGLNYLPSHYFVYGPDSTWNRPAAGTGSILYEDWAGNLGGRIAELSQGATLSFTVTGTSCDIWYATNGGTFTYQVDGGAGTQVNTAGTYVANNRVAGVSLGAAGSHTVLITATTGTAYIGGLTVYNGDTGAGLQLYEAAHSGWTATNHLQDSSQQTQAWATLAPDLAIITLGLNDAKTRTAAQFKTDLQAIVNALTALPKVPSILLVAAYAPDQGAMGYSPATWQTFVQAMKDIAASDPGNITCLDLSAVMPVATTSGAGFYSSDGIHPNNSGHTEIASRVATAVGVNAKTADVSLSVVAGVSAGATVPASASASVTVSAAVSAGSQLVRPATAALTATAALSAAAGVVKSADTAVTVTATPSAGAGRTTSGSATLTATFSPSAGGLVAQPATTSLTVTAGPSAGAARTATSDTPLTVTAGLSADSQRATTSSAALTATAASTANSQRATNTAAELPIAATPSSAATIVRTTTTTLTTTATPTAAATGTLTSSAPLTVTANPTAEATVQRPGVNADSPLPITVTLASGASRTATFTALLPLTSIPTATGLRTTTTLTTLAVSTTLLANTILTRTAQTTLAATATPTSHAERATPAGGQLATTLTLTATATLISANQLRDITLTAQPPNRATHITPRRCITATPKG